MGIVGSSPQSTAEAASCTVQWRQGWGPATATGLLSNVLPMLVTTITYYLSQKDLPIHLRQHAMKGYAAVVVSSI